MNKLTEIANRLGTDKGTMDYGHGYTELYDLLFMNKKNQVMKMLEIGINDPRFPGASMKLWKEYFNYLTLVGFDNNPEALQYADVSRSIYVHLGDQSKAIDIIDCGHSYGPFDIIVDDGSHISEHIINCFENFYPYLKMGGMYIIEDLHAGHAERDKTIATINGIITRNGFPLSHNSLQHHGKLYIVVK